MSLYTLQLKKYAFLAAYHVLFQIRTFVANRILSRISPFLLRFLLRKKQILLQKWPLKAPGRNSFQGSCSLPLLSWLVFLSPHLPKWQIMASTKCRPPSRPGSKTKFRLLAGGWCAAGTYAIQGKPVDQKIILYYYYCMMRMFKSYPELEIAEPTGDLEKMQFSCCLNLSNFFIRLSICLASLVCTCCFRWKMLEDGSRSNLWTMGGQVHYTHYCWPILCKH